MAITLTDKRNIGHALARDSAFHSDTPSAKLPEFRADEAFLKEGLARAHSSLAASAPITAPFERLEKQTEHKNERNETVTITQALEFRTKADRENPAGVTIIAGPAKIQVPLNPENLTELVVGEMKRRFTMKPDGQTLSADIEAVLNALKNTTEGGATALKNFSAKNVAHDGFNAVGADLAPVDPEKSKIEQCSLSKWNVADANMAGRIFHNSEVELDARRANMQGTRFTATAEGATLDLNAIDADLTGAHIDPKVKIINLDGRGATLVDVTFGDGKLADFILKNEIKDIKAALNNFVYDDDSIFSRNDAIQKEIIAKLDQCSIEVELKTERKYTGKLVIDNFSGSSLYNTLNSTDDKIMTVFWRDGTSSRLQLSEDGKKVAVTEIQKDGTEKVLSSNFSGEQAADYLTKRHRGIPFEPAPAPVKTPPPGPDGGTPKGEGRRIVNEGAKPAEDAEKEKLVAAAEALRKAAAEEHHRIQAQEKAAENERILKAGTDAAVANGVDKPLGLTTGLIGDAATMAAAVAANGAEPTPAIDEADGAAVIDSAPDSGPERTSRARRINSDPTDTELDRDRESGREL